ncbi:MAG: hypothetical protein ACYTEQ_05735 [Planctomycetota bacterium]|jgi:hypothetical protein
MVIVAIILSHVLIFCIAAACGAKWARQEAAQKGFFEYDGKVYRTERSEPYDCPRGKEG